MFPPVALQRVGARTQRQGKQKVRMQFFRHRSALQNFQLDCSGAIRKPERAAGLFILVIAIKAFFGTRQRIGLVGAV